MDASTSLYVMHDELRLICGRTKKSKQIEWLKSRRIKHTTNAYGQPVVLRAHLESVLGNEKVSTGAGPNWEGMFA